MCCPRRRVAAILFGMACTNVQMYVEARVSLPSSIQNFQQSASQFMDESRHNAQELLENSPFSGNLLPGRRAGSEQKKKQHKHNAAELKAENDANVANMFEVINSDGWDHVVTTSGERPITVWSRKLAPGTHLQSEAADDVAAAKFSCIKATAVIQAPPQTVYKLFLDNSRVHEYNEHCHLLEDVERLAPDTKIAWSATKPIGFLKARDFLTAVHYRTTPKGVKMAVNRPATHPSRPQSSRYQRAEVLLAGNVMAPVAGNPNLTKLTLITHINPGGIVDNAVGAALSNKLTATSPVEFIRKLEAAAMSTPAHSSKKGLGKRGGFTAR